MAVLAVDDNALFDYQLSRWIGGLELSLLLWMVEISRRTPLTLSGMAEYVSGKMVRGMCFGDRVLIRRGCRFA